MKQDVGVWEGGGINPSLNLFEWLDSDTEATYRDGRMFQADSFLHGKF